MTRQWTEAKENKMEKLLLRATEAAKLASVSRSMAYKLIAERVWPSVIVGRCIRVPLQDLRAWIEENKRTAQDDR